MLKVFFDTDNIGMITDMLDAEEHSHYPIQLFLSIDEPLKITIAGNAAGVLTFTHLKSAPWRCAFISGVPGGSTYLRAPYPPTKKASLTRSFYGVPGGSAHFHAP